jgi:hypothetical protein
MLSVLLSVEELELLVIPYCHLFENNIHFLSLWLICPSTASYYYQAMVPILRHIVITDFHPILVAASSSTVFLLLPEQNMYGSTLPSWSLWNYLSNEPSNAWNGFRTRELCLFYSADAICPRRFQTAQHSMFLLYLLVRVFTIDDSWCVRKEIWRSFWILLFFHCTSLNTCSNLDGNSNFLLKPCRWLMTLIAIGQELMGTICHACKNKSNAHSTPGVMVGSGNNCQQAKYTPKILTCGIAHPVKRKENLMGVRACRWKNANERKGYKQWQCLHQVLNTMFTTRLLKKMPLVKHYHWNKAFIKKVSWGSQA